MISLASNIFTAFANYIVALFKFSPIVAIITLLMIFFTLRWFITAGKNNPPEAPDLSGRTKEEYEIDQYFAKRNFEAKKKYYLECLEEDRKAAQEKESGNSVK